MKQTRDSINGNDALFKWVKEIVKLLQQHTGELSKIDSGIFYDVKPWTPLKLIVLGYFTSVYTKIISNQSWCNNMVYIDLFANSGINKVNKRIFYSVHHLLQYALQKTIHLTKCFLSKYIKTISVR